LTSFLGFHVIIPSLPGYGFSEAPKKFGYDTEKFASIFNELMQKLGYKEYFCQVLIIYIIIFINFK